MVRCRGGFDVQTDRRAQGQRCVEYQGQAYCAYDDACAKDRCAGDRIEICNGKVECMAPTPSGRRPADASFAGWCESDLAVTCLGGVRVEVDCGALAGGACQTGEDATARCVTASPYLIGK